MSNNTGSRSLYNIGPRLHKPLVIVRNDVNVEEKVSEDIFEKNISLIKVIELFVYNKINLFDCLHIVNNSNKICFVAPTGKNIEIYTKSNGKVILNKNISISQHDFIINTNMTICGSSTFIKSKDVKNMG